MFDQTIGQWQKIRQYYWEITLTRLLMIKFKVDVSPLQAKLLELLCAFLNKKKTKKRHS